MPLPSDSKPTSVLALYYTHKPGGMCLRLYRLLNAVSKVGAAATYLSLDPAPEGALRAGVSFRRIPWFGRRRSGLIFWALFTCWAPLYALYVTLRLKPTRFVAFGAYYAALLRLPAWIARGRLLLFVRALVFENNRLTHTSSLAIRLGDIFERIGFRLADRIICMSDVMRQRVQEFVGKRRPLAFAENLPNDIPSVADIGSASGGQAEIVSGLRAANPRLIFTAGVLDRRKNVGFLIEALGRAFAEDRKSAIPLVVCGEGALRPALEEAALAARVPVCFLGWCANVPALLKDCDLYIHPAVHEGMSNSVLEALGARCSVQLSDTPEHREFAPEPALRFSLEDATILAQLVRRWSTDEGYRGELARLSAELRERATFNWDRAAADVVIEAR